MGAIESSQEVDKNVKEKRQKGDTCGCQNISVFSLHSGCGPLFSLSQNKKSNINLKKQGIIKKTTSGTTASGASPHMVVVKQSAWAAKCVFAYVCACVFMCVRACLGGVGAFCFEANS